MDTVKEVEGADMYDAIINALADLHEDYRDNATILYAICRLCQNY